ncbi:MAG: transporter substrate-binding domain-containing protein [Cyanobacteria bacterium]|nr:transporter substrate-binding domain-containing protein [Cyanobacteriota bacterium]
MFSRKCSGLLMVAIASTALLLGSCKSMKSDSISKPTASPSVYQRVMSAGTIRCGYLIDRPGCLKDPNTKRLSGIGIETLKLVGRNLGLKVDFTEEVDWGTMVQGLEAGRYDLVATPVWPNASRARVVTFSKPLYFSPVFAYVKAGSKLLKLTDLNDLNKPEYKIASIDGATPEVIAREDFPNASVVSLPQQNEISHMLLTVSSGKADVTFVEPAVAEAFIKSNPGTIERFPTVRPVRIFPDSWVIARGQTEFKEMIDTALEQLINSGTVAKLIKRYEPSPDTLYRVAVPYESPRN